MEIKMTVFFKNNQSLWATFEKDTVEELSSIVLQDLKNKSDYVNLGNCIFLKENFHFAIFEEVAKKKERKGFFKRLFGQ